MSESVADDQNTPKAPKDKNCPYCGQAFTSSSLGRHLDLYIKDKNPKPPDGIHDVDEIRRLRGNITRRQPRGGAAHPPKIDISTGLPLTTPGAATRRSPASEAGSGAGTPIAQHDPKDNRSAAARATAGLAPFAPRWEVTGVINDIPPTPKDTESPAQDASARRTIPPPQRQVSRQVAKAQFDMKQRVQDALDTARASELALREVLGSWRAAKSLFELKSMPFEFDPMAMDFPALVLQCLQPPPTLFSQTQLPSQSSWSITPPTSRQYEALKAHFAEAFHKWRISCASITTAVLEDITYPPTQGNNPIDIQEMARTAEAKAQESEQQISEHLESAFGVWDALSPQRRGELWIVELARSVGKRQNQAQKLEEEKHTLRQENANLKSQIEHLNRLQQPREFKIFPPSTMHFSEPLVSFMQEQGVVHNRSTTALNMNDRHSDLDTVVKSALDRWKNVIVAARTASGMNAQRQLDPAQSPHPSSAPGASGGGITPATPSGPPSSTPAHRPSVPILQQAPQPRHHMTATPSQVPAFAPPTSEDTSTPITATTTSALYSAPPPVATTADTWTPSAATSSIPTSSIPSIDEDDTSEQDADAEMEDDMDFSIHPPQSTAPAPAAFMKQQPPPTPPQQSAQLQVPRTRGGRGGLQQQQQQQQQHQLGMNGMRSMTQSIGKYPPGMASPGGMGRGRSATGMSPGIQRQTRHFTAQQAQAQAQHQHQHQQQHQPQHHQQHQQHQHQQQHQHEMNMGMHQGLGGDPMYMD